MDDVWLIFFLGKLTFVLLAPIDAFFRIFVIYARFPLVDTFSKIQSSRSFLMN